MSNNKKGFSSKALILAIITVIIILLLFGYLVNLSINDTKQESADKNAEECYKIATTRYADKDSGYESNLYEGCIILTSNGNYFLEKKYGGSKDIIEVYWFENTNNWNVAYGKLTNFEEVIDIENIYGIYKVK
jgi:hypothetical protein